MPTKKPMKDVTRRWDYGVGSVMYIYNDVVRIQWDDEERGTYFTRHEFDSGPFYLCKPKKKIDAAATELPDTLVINGATYKRI